VELYNFFFKSLKINNIKKKIEKKNKGVAIFLYIYIF
jgi:hypothetical protein